MLWCEYTVCHSTGVSGYIRCIWLSASPPSSVGLLVKGCVVHPSIMLSGWGYPQGVDWALEWIIDTSDSWQPYLHKLLGSIQRNTLSDLIGPCKNWVEADPRGVATLVWLVWGNEWMGKLCDTLKPTLNNVPKTSSHFQTVQMLSNAYARTLGIVLLRGVTLWVLTLQILIYTYRNK